MRHTESQMIRLSFKTIFDEKLTNPRVRRAALPYVKYPIKYRSRKYQYKYRYQYKSYHYKIHQMTCMILPLPIRVLQRVFNVQLLLVLRIFIE